MLHKKETAAILEAVGAAVVWGYAFVVLKEAIETFGPLWIRAITFGFVGLSILPVSLIFTRFRSHVTLAQARHAGLPGCLLGASLSLQSVGLEYTSIANCGFITVLSIVFIPLGERFLFRLTLKRNHIAAVCSAILGSILLCGGLPTTWSKGDLIVFVSAILAAAHILSLKRVATKVESPYSFNLLQISWAAVITTPFAVVFDVTPTGPFYLKDFAAVLYLAVVSVLIGFMLQFRAQRVLSSTVTSLVCLLEAPFAAAFAFVILGEVLNFTQSLGASLIMFASILAIAATYKKNLATRTT
jgi:drug/metabolite transporter (DMT)-like permease